MYKNRDFCKAPKTKQHQKCVPGGGPARGSACATLPEFGIVKIQLVLPTRLARTKSHVRQVIGIIILSRASNGRKLHLKMQPSEMCPALKEK